MRQKQNDFGRKALLPFMVEAMWRVKVIAIRKRDVAREVVSAAEKLLDFRGVKPQEIWEFTFSQDSEKRGQRRNEKQYFWRVRMKRC